MGNVLAVLEQRDGVIKHVSHEVLTAARQVADARGVQVYALVIGSADIDVSNAGTYGADTVTVVAGDNLALYQPGAYAEAVASQTDGHDVVILAATALGKDLAPRVAARLDCALAVDVTEIDAAAGLTVKRPAYSGKAVYTIEIDGPAVISVRPNVFAAAEAPREAKVQTVTASAAESRALTVRVKEPETSTLDVAEASIVVSGGRGLKDPKNFSLIEELAKAFGGAAVGASRAVVDAGWRGHAEQVGQTGKTVSPQLYVAVGISGAVQHLAGMRTSKVIVAINKDADAPIFKIADYGIVGDLFEVVPPLTEAVREARGN